jgi:methylthioribose-1-phosphate isomerase
VDSVRWQSEGEALLPGKLRLIDQTLLPEELRYIELDDRAAIWDAIKRLAVRGAPAIGCAAALGLAAISQHVDTICVDAFMEEVSATATYLETSRPTAVNLAWALRRCLRVVRSAALVECSVEELKEVLVQEGLSILHEDIELCRAIGQQGVQLFADREHLGILTHCNAGALATGDFGTALAPIYAAQELGLAPRVFADETRPLLQGSRLTAWELQRQGVDVTVICDNMAAQVMREGRIDLVIVGTDRIAANGDIANKIGTYGVAILADYHKIPFYVATPYSTIDLDLPTGGEIPIEQRAPDEIGNSFGRQTAPSDCPAYNPAFDITPAELIAGIITERGILSPPFPESIAHFMRTRR